jgi:long-subunit fatty acid transport protein
MGICLLLPAAAYASFIETTIGTAVVNDATATYFNPAALVLLKNPQFIPLGTMATFRSNFSGQTTRIATGAIQSGSSSSRSYYTAPSLYLGVPTTNKLTLGIAVLSNMTNRDTEESSILRYVESSNSMQEYDLVPAIGIKINEFFSVGGGLDLAYANFHLRPITGFPQSNIADSENQNDCAGTAVGVDLGLLLKVSPATLIGFNYRSTTTYRLSGTSVYNGDPQVYSNDYHFKLRKPAHSVLSINHFVTPALGFIGTIQYIQWSILRNINVNGIATLVGSQPTIINASVPYHMHDTLAFTLGTLHRMNPKWVLRLAGTYNQSPGNNHYQVTNGDSIIIGASTGYKINEVMDIDGGYAHAFIQNQNINISGSRFLINGVNKGSRDAVSLKLTFNI